MFCVFSKQLGSSRWGWSHGVPCSAHRGLEPPGKKLPWQMGKGGLVFTWMENHNTWGRTKKCTTVRMQTTANHARPGVLTGCGARGQGGGGALPVDSPVHTYPRSSSLSLQDHHGPQESRRGHCPRYECRAVPEAVKVPECGLSKALKSKGGAGLGT